jgi:iron complex transport system ATP-binding protein
MKQDTPTIRTQNLTIGYGKSQVLDGITVSATSGSLIALLGANGAGKSTLLKTLAGLCKRIGGDLWYGENNSMGMSPREKAKIISLVLTDRIFPGYMTVAELVALGRYPYTDWRGKLNLDDKTATEEALIMTGLPGIANKDLHELSDGQLQKALIARALAQDSTIMLLDEPLIHLDIPSKWEIMALLKRMARDKQKTIILATHELDLSLKTADRIWLINKKRDLVTGTPDQMITNKTIAETFNTDHYQFS